MLKIILAQSVKTCVSRVSVSSVLLAVEILGKNDKASQVKCRQRPFWSVSVLFRCGGEKSVHGRPSRELALLLIRIGSQTAWEAVRLDFIDNKDKIIAKDYELHGRCDFLHYVL